MASPPADDHDWYEKSQRGQPQPSNAVLVERLNSLLGGLKRVESKIDQWDVKVLKIQQDADDRYITSDEFQPVKILVYGFVALVCIGFVGLLLHTVGWKP